MGLQDSREELDQILGKTSQLQKKIFITTRKTRQWIWLPRGGCESLSVKILVVEQPSVAELNLHCSVRLGLKYVFIAVIGARVSLA